MGRFKILIKKAGFVPRKQEIAFYGKLTRSKEKQPFVKDPSGLVDKIRYFEFNHREPIISPSGALSNLVMITQVYKKKSHIQ